MGKKEKKVEVQKPSSAIDIKIKKLQDAIVKLQSKKQWINKLCLNPLWGEVVKH